MYLAASLREATLLVKLHGPLKQQQMQHSEMDFYHLLDQPIQEMPGKRSLTPTVSMGVEYAQV